MRFRRHLAVVVFAALVGLAGTASPAAAATSVLRTTLTGAQEVHDGMVGTGDPAGRGTAIVIVNPRSGRICYVIHVRGITLPATAAHIHEGAAGVAGPVVVGLEAPGATGHSVGCVKNPTEAQAIAANPSNYYVNVHTSDYPAGALRGQLG